MAANHLLIIFAKAPLPGRVKTRLAKVLGPTKAAAAYKAILKFLIQSAAASGPDTATQKPGQPSAFSPFFDSKLYLASDRPTAVEAKAEFYSAGGDGLPDLPVVIQTGPDLGARMGNALWQESSRYERIILIGTDYPYLTGSVIGRLLDEEVGKTPMTFGPTADGGYYFVAVCPRKLAAVTPWPAPSAPTGGGMGEGETPPEGTSPIQGPAEQATSIKRIFGNIPWSTEMVLNDQIRNLQAAGIEYTLMPTGTDIDHFHDLEAFLKPNHPYGEIIERFPLPAGEVERLNELRDRLRRLI